VIGTNFLLARRIKRHSSLHSKDSGFSILEMLIASAIMLVGIISVVQLVPVSLRLSTSNRLDTLATVIAQRELDQMLSQPLAVNAFTDRDGKIVSLGGAGSPGAPVVLDGQGAPQINFTAGTVAGFVIPAYKDANDPNGATFELRWAVIPQVSGGRTVSKRIIIGCRQTNANRPSLPINLDSWVQK
jgi:prepilin-type N-terminal cleavage/methylation domain-containing protein